MTDGGRSGTSTAHQAVAEAPSSRVVAKPVPHSLTQDPRRYQLDQLKRRFSPTEETLENGTTTLFFKISPSDPDFPYELDFLEVELRVPASYPEGAPTISVKNKNIPKGFALNIERGWDRLVEGSRNSTLLALIHALDRKLEEFLSEKKADTVKVVIFKDTRHLEGKATTTEAEHHVQAAKSSNVPPSAPEQRYVPRESFSHDQISEAKARRALETRQLESRMSTLPLYFKSKDGIVYTLPLEPRRRNELPAGIRGVSSFQLVVPLLYPLQPLVIVLNDVDPADAEAIESAFARRSQEHNEQTLLNHVNYLSQNLHILAKKAPPKEVPAKADGAEEAAETTGGVINAADDQKTHIKIIPRPPEWTMVNEPGGADSSDDESVYDSEDSEGGGVMIERPGKEAAGTTQDDAERGTAIYFPNVDLHGVDLLKVSALSINVRCERCKTVNEALALKPGTQKSDTCKKCASPFTVLFRQQLVHQNSTRAGFVDVAGCTVFSLLARYVRQMEHGIVMKSFHQRDHLRCPKGLLNVNRLPLYVVRSQSATERKRSLWRSIPGSVVTTPEA